MISTKRKSDLRDARASRREVARYPSTSRRRWMPPTRLLTPSSCCTDCCPARQKCGFTSSTVLIPRWRQKILSALAACDMLTDNLMTAYTPGSWRTPATYRLWGTSSGWSRYYGCVASRLTWPSRRHPCRTHSRDAMSSRANWR